MLTSSNQWDSLFVFAGTDTFMIVDSSTLVVKKADTLALSMDFGKTWRASFIPGISNSDIIPISPWLFFVNNDELFRLNYSKPLDFSFIPPQTKLVKPISLYYKPYLNLKVKMLHNRSIVFSVSKTIPYPINLALYSLQGRLLQKLQF